MKHHVLSIHLKNQTLNGIRNPFKSLVLLAILLTSSVGPLMAATINVAAGQSIQTAINGASAGDIIIVAPGTYNENLNINKSITLISSGGRASTFINGAPGTNGTVVVAASTVTLGDVNQGFTITGFDGLPGSETAAVYVQGVQSAITIRGNEIKAAGDGALLTEFNNAVDNFTVEGNIFSGKTFVGAIPAGCGSSQQFTLLDVPRQLVYIAKGTGILFSNNTITGTSGGASPCGPNGQGNNLVTIFGNTGSNATICGNTFSGTTASFRPSLEVKNGTGASVTNNTFNSGGLMGSQTTHFIAGSTSLTGGTPSTIAGVASMNIFSPEGYYVTGINVIYKNSAEASAFGTPIAANSGAIANASCPTCLGTTTPVTPTAVGNTAICDDDNNGIQRVRVDQTCATGNAPVWYINGALATGVSGATVITNTNNANYGRLTYDQPVGTTTYTYACKSANNCQSAQSPGLPVTVSQLSAPTGVSVTVNGTTVNAGETSTLCDTDTESPNALTLAATCSSGTLQWRSKTGEADWTNYASLPSSQASDGVPVQYQARCRQVPCAAESGIVTITINPKPSVAPTSITNVSCNGGNNGSISVMGSGGTPGIPTSYTYIISPGGTINSTGTFEGLSAGSYTVTVQDANTCTATTSNITIEEPSAVTVTPGPNKSVVFTPAPGSNCTLISAQGNGGSGTYTYNWTSSNPNELPFTGQNPQVCPTVTTIYTVIATDANGCPSAPAQVTVFVNDVRCGNKNQNVVICYYGVTQCVSEKTAKNYIKLGATMGACGSNAARLSAEVISDTPLTLTVKAYPNPTTGALTVQINSPAAGLAQLDVLDVAGRAVQQRSQQLSEGLNEMELNLGSHAQGTYLIRCRDILGRQAVVRVQKQ